MEGENIGVGGNSAISSLKNVIFNLAGLFACEIEPKVEPLGRFQPSRNFRYQVLKRSKSHSK